ncbi:MBL fold metallo-hydrolase [Metabacillus litoralis]|uniref:MBL fold metallo-hydrolase n=1 Tax=Metabacillus litoralis TaxID=152268 RepID=UPI000EF58F83|nr:MBL fold metallo-hydrolase [Metabacillus litoralis]MCM3161369.1 MBL fold metallo-hydrolase [Metabacillus litoralis]
MSINMMKIFACGYCTHPEKIVNPQKTLKTIKFPATVALLKHPTIGYILFDTGYASYFLEATKVFPYSIYANLTPVFFSEERSIKNQLKKQDINHNDIKIIILSHFHGDHVGGLKDFPNAKIVTFKKAYNHIKKLSKLRALTKGCLLDLLPQDFQERVSFIDEKPLLPLGESYHPFTGGFDVFGDDSIIAVDLTGHAIGQLGIFVNLSSGKKIFLCADAVWQSTAFENMIFPHRIAHLLIEDIDAYKQNLKKLHLLSKQNQHIEILPTHCQKTWEIAKEGIIYE